MKSWQFFLLCSVIFQASDKTNSLAFAHIYLAIAVVAIVFAPKD